MGKTEGGGWWGAGVQFIQHLTEHRDLGFPEQSGSQQFLPSSSLFF